MEIREIKEEYKCGDDDDFAHIICPVCGKKIMGLEEYEFSPCPHALFRFSYSTAGDPYWVFNGSIDGEAIESEFNKLFYSESEEEDDEEDGGESFEKRFTKIIADLPSVKKLDLDEIIYMHEAEIECYESVIIFGVKKHIIARGRR